jgi:hypothetical protein
MLQMHQRVAEAILNQFMEEKKLLPGNHERLPVPLLQLDLLPADQEPMIWTQQCFGSADLVALPYHWHFHPSH